MNSKRVTFSLLGMYLLPWGIQYLVNNFMSVYVASFPFSTEKTVGEILGIGALVTCLAQAAWSYIAGKAKNKAKKDTKEEKEEEKTDKKDKSE